MRGAGVLPLPRHPPAGSCACARRASIRHKLECEFDSITSRYFSIHFSIQYQIASHAIGPLAGCRCPVVNTATMPKPLEAP